MSEIWRRIAKHRLGRRRTLQLGGTVASAGVVGGLVAAGIRARRHNRTTEGGEGLVGTPLDTLGQARSGGTLRSTQAADTPSMDPIVSPSFMARVIAAHTYPRILRFAAAKFPDPPSSAVEGDLAESFEVSPDKLQLRFTLRQRLAWDFLPPTSGRLIDAQDVVASFDRYRKLSPFRGDLFYDASSSPFASLESVSAPDERTVIFRLHAPDAALLQSLATTSTVFIMPREADGGFDPHNQTRGYGPWRLDDYQPSVRFLWTRNPDYYVRGRPFFDRIEQPIVPDYATRLAEFRAGNIWNSVATQEDVLQTKQELPVTRLIESDLYGSIWGSLGFGYADNSPWKDQRLRQAVNYLLDREAMVDGLSNRRRFGAAGIDLGVRYNTIIGAGWEGYWVDPLDEKKFGENSRFFRYNPAEAGKLLAAAGFPNGLDTALYINGSSNYGPEYPRYAEVIAQMLTEGGIRPKLRSVSYVDWLPSYHFAHTKAFQPPGAVKGFDGLALRVKGVAATLPQTLFANQHPDGSAFEGCTPNGRDPESGDPRLSAAIERFRGEFDPDRQRQIALEIARFGAESGYFIQASTFAARNFDLVWPVIGNYGVFRSAPNSPQIAESALQWWLDDSKPPLVRGS